MANRSFDFNKMKRSFYTITLKDGREIMVKMPQKKVFEKITEHQVGLKDATLMDMDATLDSLCAEIISNNVAKIRITEKYMADHYEFEEKILFFNDYMDFVYGVSDAPN